MSASIRRHLSFHLSLLILQSSYLIIMFLLFLAQINSITCTLARREHTGDKQHLFGRLGGSFQYLLQILYRLHLYIVRLEDDESLTDTGICHFTVGHSGYFQAVTQVKLSLQFGRYRFESCPNSSIPASFTTFVLP